MISCYTMGGLGNQLFQIYSTLSYSIETQKKPVFFNSNTPLIKGHTHRTTYWDTFFENLSCCLIEKETFQPFFTIKETKFNFQPELFEYIKKVKINVLLFGYFQSYKYFDKNKREINALIGIQKKQEETKEKWKNIIFLSLNNNNLLDVKREKDTTFISMHFRLGDYVDIQDKHPVLPLDYYIKSLDFILKTKNINPSLTSVIVFCEENDFFKVEQNINQLQEIYQNLKFQFIPFDIPDWEQIIIMSLCENNIIANSTFSWWGAYFNSSKNKIVCYPQLWFGPLLENNNTCDMFPSEWIKIN